jgi:hypothetical protein
MARLRLDLMQKKVSLKARQLTHGLRGGEKAEQASSERQTTFVIKCISRTELQMFRLRSSYFEYLSKAFFHGL